MAQKYLDDNGLLYFWQKIKNVFQEKLVSGTNIKTINNQSIVGGGNLNISGGVSDVQVDGTSVVTGGVAEVDLTGKVDKVTGKGLSSNDFTTALLDKLNGIAAGAEVNVQSDWNAVSGDAMILNKPTIPEDKVFIAEYDVTTYSEVESWVSSDAEVICIIPNTTLPIALGNNPIALRYVCLHVEEMEIEFGGIIGRRSITLLLQSDDSWQYTLTTLASDYSPTFTGTPKAPTASSGTNNTQIATTAFVADAVSTAVTGAVAYQGIAPTTFAPTDYKAGWYWIVGTAGTYCGQTCEAGDMIFCKTAASAYSDANFDIVQTNLDITQITNAEIDTIVAS